MGTGADMPHGTQGGSDKLIVADPSEDYLSYELIFVFEYCSCCLHWENRRNEEGCAAEGSKAWRLKECMDYDQTQQMNGRKDCLRCGSEDFICLCFQKHSHPISQVRLQVTNFATREFRQVFITFPWRSSSNRLVLFSEGLRAFICCRRSLQRKGWRISARRMWMKCDNCFLTLRNCLSR